MSKVIYMASHYYGHYELTRREEQRVGVGWTQVNCTHHGPTRERFHFHNALHVRDRDMDRELPRDYTKQEVHEYESDLVRGRDVKLQGAGFHLPLSDIIQTL